MLWKDEPQQLELQKPFHKAMREAKFIFPQKSGVYDFLEEFSIHAFHITHFAGVRDAFSGLPQQQVELSLTRTDHVNWILSSMPSLEDKMRPYLHFESL